MVTEFSDKHLAGGYLAINKSTIEQFLFPKDVSAGIQQKIANIARSIHIEKLKDPRSDTSKLENQIDEMISHLHGI